MKTIKTLSKKALKHLSDVQMSEFESAEFLENLLNKFNLEKETALEYLQDTMRIDSIEFDKVYTLALHLGLSWGEMQDIISRHDEFSYGNKRFYVLTDMEADERCDEYIENYIEECVIHQIPKKYRYYFDTEKFKDDCKEEGRGPFLATYDGHEHECQGEKDVYFIYRIN